MEQVVIENPVINSPFSEPTRHFRFNDDGITNEIIAERRESACFVPIPRPRKKSRQLSLLADTEWTQERYKVNELVNNIRYKVGLWRRSGYAGVTPVTSRLLAYWTAPEREKKLFFCQIEALETLIYITEVAFRAGDQWIANKLREANAMSDPGLPRMAIKMATGAGKTGVMAMLIAWQALNKQAASRDPRFSDIFLLIAPGITIRDRLRVLLPNDPQNYYRQRDVIPSQSIEALGQAKFLIANFHAFRLREKATLGKVTKSLLPDEGKAFLETPAEMARRVCRELGNKKNGIVINDEAHHCYRRKPDSEKEKLTGDDRKEVQKREEEARIWISGIEAVKAKIGVKAIYDLSATPFSLRGSGFGEGTLFPWVVSDFSLTAAIAAGIVKVPRVPVSDNSGTDEQPTSRGLWTRIREGLPSKGRKAEAVEGERNFRLNCTGPCIASAATMRSISQWEQNDEAGPKCPVWRPA